MADGINGGFIYLACFVTLCVAIIVEKSFIIFSLLKHTKWLKVLNPEDLEDLQ